MKSMTKKTFCDQYPSQVSTVLAGVPLVENEYYILYQREYEARKMPGGHRLYESRLQTMVAGRRKRIRNATGRGGRPPVHDSNRRQNTLEKSRSKRLPSRGSRSKGCGDC